MNFAAMFAGAASLVPGLYGPAVATWPGTATRDAGGSITAPGVAQNVACRVQFDRVTDAMRSSDDFVDTDVRIIVLADGLTRPIDQQARIIVASGPHAGTWSIRSVDQDPAGIGFECRGRKV
ncbi:MAG: hypothetical protein V4530_06135 [Pseudomonadota bacterium]